MRGLLRKILLVVLAVGVVAVLVYRSRRVIRLEGFSWDRLFDSLQQADPALLLVSLAAIFVAYAIRAQRWVRFSRYIGRASFANVYRSTLTGFTAIFLLGRAGEPIRPLLIARKDGLPVSGTFGIYVLERVFDAASTIALAGVSLLIFPRRVFSARGSDTLLAAARTTGMLMLAGLLAAVVFLVYFRLHGAGALERRLQAWQAGPGAAGWPAPAGWRVRVAGLFAGFGEGLQAIRSSGDLFAAIGYSAVHWLLVAYIYLWVPISFGGRLAQLDFPGAMLVLAFTMVGSTLQLPGVGGGAQLASFLAFTLIFGIEKEPAAAASIVLWLITFAGSSLAGIPLLIREGWSMAELRRLARAEAEAAGMHVTATPGSRKSIREAENAPPGAKDASGTGRETKDVSRKSNRDAKDARR